MSAALSTFYIINSFFVNSIHFVLMWIKTTFLLPDNDSFCNNFLRVHVQEVQESRQDQQYENIDLDDNNTSDEARFYATQRDQVFQQQQKVKFDHFHDSLDQLRTSQRTFLSADRISHFSKDPYGSHFPDIAEVFNTNLINKNFRLHFD